MIINEKNLNHVTFFSASIKRASDFVVSIDNGKTKWYWSYLIKRQEKIFDTFYVEYKILDSDRYIYKTPYGQVQKAYGVNFDLDNIINQIRKHDNK